MKREEVDMEVREKCDGSEDSRYNERNQQGKEIQFSGGGGGAVSLIARKTFLKKEKVGGTSESNRDRNRRSTLEAQ